MHDNFGHSRLSLQQQYSDKLDPIFVVGCMRSGTSWLFSLLQSHPDVVPTTGYPTGEDHVGWAERGAAVVSGIGYVQNANRR